MWKPLVHKFPFKNLVFTCCVGWFGIGYGYIWVYIHLALLLICFSSLIWLNSQKTPVLICQFEAWKVFAEEKALRQSSINLSRILKKRVILLIDEFSDELLWCWGHLPVSPGEISHVCWGDKWGELVYQIELLAFKCCARHSLLPSKHIFS